MRVIKFLVLIIFCIFQIAVIHKIQAQNLNVNTTLKLMLHGLGKAGDNVSAGTGNPDPNNTTRDVTLEFYNSANQLAKSVSGDINYNTDAGNFQGIVVVPQVASGLYTVKVKVDYYLHKYIPGVVNVSSGGGLELPQIALVTGDTNKDNKLNILDYNQILDCFSSLTPPVNCSDLVKKRATDLTDDGNVNQFDYNLFLREVSVQGGDGEPTPFMTPTPTPIGSGDGPFNLIPPTNAEVEAVGMISVRANGADPTCVNDATAAIQQTINQAYERRMAVFFPSGTYCVSSTIIAKRIQDRSDRTHELIGSTMGSKPVIKLKANSSGFNNQAVPKPVLYIYTINGPQDNNPGAPNDAVGYNQSLRNIHIEIEENNSGAVGVEFTGAQGNSLENVSINLKSGYAGFAGMIGTNSVISNIEVIGGKYGLTASVMGGLLRWPSITNVRLINQTDAAIYRFSPSNFMISGFHIKKQRGPAIVTSVASPTFGNFSLLDGIIEFEAPSDVPAIQNAGGKAIALVNVYFRNANKIVQNIQGAGINGGAGWKKVNIYAAVQNDLNLINGQLLNTDYSEALTVAEPTLDIVTKHGISITDYPSPDHILARIKAGDTKVVNVRNHGIEPAQTGTWDDQYGSGNNTSPDVADKLQTLINSGAEIIFFPKGKYIISKTIDLKDRTHITGISKELSAIYMSELWRPTTANPLSMIRTPDSSTANPKLSFMRIKYRMGSNYNYVKGALHIRSAKTETNDFGVGSDLEQPTTARANVRIWITGNGGGRFHGMGLASGGESLQHKDYRHLLIEGTTKPIMIYGANPEDQDANGTLGGWGIEVVGSRNIAFLGAKNENHNTMLVRASENIVFLGLFNNDNVTFHDNNNYMGSMYPKTYSGETLFSEKFQGITKNIAENQEISLIKRGIVNWSAFWQ